MDPTDDRLHRLDDRLGEAALDPSRWSAVLSEVSTLVGGDGAMLLQSHRRTPGVPCTPEIDALVADYFGQGWHVKDLRTRAVPRVMRGETVTDHDILTPGEMARAPFYNELLRPHGYHWFAVAGFPSGPEHWAVSVQRTTRRGPFEAAQVLPLTGLMRRLGQAAALSEALGRAALDGTLRGLDQIAQAALALDGAGRVIGANPRAEVLFDAAFRVADGALRIADPRARDEVAALVEAPGRAAPAGPILVPRRERRPLVLRLLPLAGAVRSPFLGARALLLVTDLEAEARPDPALLTQIFGLTTAEARLAALLAGGASLEGAAEALGIAVETARSQIKAVFAKTGTGRQGALVALLGAPGLR